MNNKFFSRKAAYNIYKNAFCVILSLMIISGIAPAMSVFAEEENLHPQSEQVTDQSEQATAQGESTNYNTSADESTADNEASDGDTAQQKDEQVSEEKDDSDVESTTPAADKNSNTVNTVDSNGEAEKEEPANEGSANPAAKIGDTEYETLQEAVDAAADGQTIILLRDIKESVKLAKKNVKIDGKGFTVRGDNASVFYITGGRVTIENLTATEGNGRSGGGIYASGGTLTIKNCNIVNNNAEHGGGLYTDNAGITIQNTKIDNNVANGNGGAYYIYMSAAKTIQITDSSMCNNTANRSGAVCACLYDAVRLFITNTKINNNKGDGGMFGAVALSGYKNPLCNIKGGEIIGNTGYEAGGLDIDSVRVNIDGTKIRGNHATSTEKDAAGGIKVDGFSDGSFSMTSGVLEGNTTAGSGKANDIYIDKYITNVQLMRPSQMDIEDAESRAWRDVINDIITSEGISGQKSFNRYFTLVNEKVIAEGIYIDGVNGNDDAEGTLEHPVKTPGRVKELLEKYGLDTAKVLGTIELSEDIDMDGATLIRADEFTKDPIFRITRNSDVRITNTIVDGNSESDVSVASPLVTVETAATLTLDKGSVIQNNAVGASTNNIEAGGIECYGNLIMEDGATVRNNKGTLGGGILIESGSFVMNGGDITGNKAVEIYYEDRKFSYGGGVLLIRGAKMTMNGGSVDSNKADGSGGGISLGHLISESVTNNGTVTFEMNGGEISGNTAFGAGGGIFVQCSTVAVLNAGYITDNQAEGSEAAHAGGGIYINGYHEDYLKEEGIDHGKLYAYNTEISGNQANGLGGAIACCGTGHGIVGNNLGTAIFDNTNGREEKTDIFFDGTDWNPYMGGWWIVTKPEKLPYISYVSTTMLNGADYHWVENENKAADAEALATINSEYKLRTDASETDKDVIESQKMTTVHITGNKSFNNGGGIGCNGMMFFGDAVESEYEEYEEPEEIIEEEVSEEETETKAEVKGVYELSEEPKEIETVSTVKGVATGDRTDMMNLIALMVCSAALLIAIGHRRRSAR